MSSEEADESNGGFNNYFVHVFVLMPAIFHVTIQKATTSYHTHTQEGKCAEGVMAYISLSSQPLSNKQ